MHVSIISSRVYRVYDARWQGNWMLDNNTRIMNLSSGFSWLRKQQQRLPVGLWISFSLPSTRVDPSVVVRESCSANHWLRSNSAWRKRCNAFYLPVKSDFVTVINIEERKIKKLVLSSLVSVLGKKEPKHNKTVSRFTLTAFADCFVVVSSRSGVKKHGKKIFFPLVKSSLSSEHKSRQWQMTVRDNEWCSGWLIWLLDLWLDWKILSSDSQRWWAFLSLCSKLCDGQK